MYAKYWKLKEKPFENTPNPRFFYHSQRHEEALSRMRYVVREGKGAAILTGEYGSGKTILSRVLMEELKDERYKTALIFNPKLPTINLLEEIIYQLGGEFPSSSIKAILMHQLNEILYNNHSLNKNTIILIDEAQAIEDKESFEELRLLLNFQLNDAFLLTLILIGQPELKTKIDSLPQLKQRMAIRYHLRALNEEETKGYVKHRLNIAGAQEEIFVEDAYSEMYRFSGGIPRKINNICDLALLVGCGEGLNKIDRDKIKEVAEDLDEVPIEMF